MMIDIRIAPDDKFRHKEIGYRHQISLNDMENIVPREIIPGMDPFEFVEVQRSEETRKRFIDALSANIAYSLTDYLINEYKKERKWPTYEKGTEVIK